VLKDSNTVGLSEELWAALLERLSQRIDSARIRAWLLPCRLLSRGDNEYLLAVPNSYLDERVRSVLMEDLRESLAALTGRTNITIKTVVDPDLPPPDATVLARRLTGSRRHNGPDSAAATAPTTAAAPAELPLDHSFSDFGEDISGPAARRSGAVPLVDQEPPERDVVLPPSLSPKYTFENFVVGDSNRLAHHAARAVAEQPAQVYNPLFIHGGVGLGKTHLLHAIGIEVLRHSPKKKVEYVTSETFINDFITAIRYDKTHQFKQRYRSVDVLLVDDIQFLANSERTQEEFFHTFNALYNDDKQIVITSDQPPSHIGNIETRLRSRFSLGLTADIQAPDFETRVAILRRLADNHRVPAPDNVLTYIATQYTDNIRELQGALTRVIAAATLNRAPVTLDLAIAELDDTNCSNAASVKPTSPQLIMQEVAAYYNVSVEDLTSPARRRSVVIARHVAMYLCRTLTDLSLPQIGTLFGGRDHTTVLHSIRKIDSLIKQRRPIYTQISELTNRLRVLSSSSHEKKKFP
jgi:chromosomal replication initiator protein